MSGMGMPGSLGKLSTALHEQLAIDIEKKERKKKGHSKGKTTAQPKETKDVWDSSGPRDQSPRDH